MKEKNINCYDYYSEKEISENILLNDVILDGIHKKICTHFYRWLKEQQIYSEAINTFTKFFKNYIATQSDKLDISCHILKIFGDSIFHISKKKLTDNPIYVDITTYIDYINAVISALKWFYIPNEQFVSRQVFIESFRLYLHEKLKEDVLN